jgi:GDP/UDP-N,N'-diacetylbacillosamine 2-epimerase (hydrolysing)
MSKLTKRKVCVITGSRADYGLLRWVMQGISDDPDLILQLIVTGMHLSTKFGLTYKEIENDGFYIDRKIEILDPNDDELGISRSIGKAVIEITNAILELKPDLVLILGDRFEIFAAASAAHICQIPIAHLHGGETTVGAFDEAFRHSITKMSQIHFVANRLYGKRVVQLGENSSNIFVVGGLGIDNILRLQLLDKIDLENSLNIKFSSKNLLITFHPVTLENNTAEKQIKELLDALITLHDTTLIFTLPNADTGGSKIAKAITEFVQIKERSYFFNSLGQLRYLSCLSHVDGVVGNSSSGILEAPSFKKGTINIGDRQNGRLFAESVITCEPIKKEILSAITTLYSDEFQSSLNMVISPYGNGGASDKIIEVLKTISLEGIIKKRFFDLIFPIRIGEFENDAS